MSSLRPFLPEFFQFRCPTKIVYGQGLASDFSAELETLTLKRLFILTDAVLHKNGVAARVIEGLKAAGKEIAGVFTDIPSDSGIKVIEHCAALAIAAQGDALVAIGGGSVIDTAKGANILVSLGGNLIDDYSGAQTIGSPLKPLVAIPTTAGTGSEVTEAIVVLDEASNKKLTFVDEHLLPTLAILDPTLTVSMPAKTTAATGMDALTHAIEAMASIQKSPICDALAFEAIRAIHTYLLQAVAEPSNLEARGAMLVAATLAGIAFDHAKVGVVHAVAHTVGGMFHIHHGTANSIFLPHGMRYNFEEAYPAYARMASAFGISTNKFSEQDLAKQTVNAVLHLRADLEKACGLPQRFSVFGVTQDAVAAIAAGAAEDGAGFHNPRPVDADAIAPFIELAL
jgi:alcohol dehydrogenase class IV